MKPSNETPGWCHGADHALEDVIKTHLFIICPGNSGSTYLKNVLATSKRTWNLAREGQITFGFAGPSAGRKTIGLIFASRKRWIDALIDISAYDWGITRKAWYFQAFSHSPDAPVFVEKSPQFLLITDELRRTFQNTRFLFMVRNPYAVVEGIRRRREKFNITSNEEILHIGATHIMACFAHQRRNIEAHREHGLFFTYETMCNRPGCVEQMIRAFEPLLYDLKLKQKVPVKGIYDEMLRNMNTEQISRLSTTDLKHINRVFSRHQELLEYFGYDLMAR